MNQNNNEKQKKEFDDYYEAGLETIDTIIGVVVTLGLLLLIGLIAFILAPSTAHAERIARIDTEKLIELTNDQRASSSVPLLSENELLSKAAKEKALDMAGREYFSHKDPEGNSVWRLIEKAGYNYKKAGENLAMDFSTNRRISSA